MRETLRLAPSAPFRSATPLEDTTLADGKYAVEADTTIVCGIYMIHRDRKLWGDDVGRLRSILEFLELNCCVRPSNSAPSACLTASSRLFPYARSLRKGAITVADVLIQPNAWQPFGYGMRGCIVREACVSQFYPH